MEFFNKKQDVIDLELTGYGKQLLSRGHFKPTYYAFSDDGIVYDGQWVSGSNGDDSQSDIETRIQEETPRLKTQARKTGAEKSMFNTLNASSLYSAFSRALEIGELNSVSALDYSVFELAELLYLLQQGYGYAEAEKLLQNTLGNKSFDNSFDPAFTALFYNGEISGSTSYYEKNNVISPKIPQLNCTLHDKAYRITADDNPYELLSKPKEVEEGLRQRQNVVNTGGENQDFEDPERSPTTGVFFEYYIGENTPSEISKANLAGAEFNLSEEEINSILDKTRASLFIEKDFLFISLEEANVDFDNDNFMVEVFEIDTVNNNQKGEEELTKMFFNDETLFGFAGEQDLVVSEIVKDRSVEEVFDIEVDKEINSQLGCYLIGKDKKLKKQSLYVDSVFDCEGVVQDDTISIDPYTGLPEVSVGDVC